MYLKENNSLYSDVSVGIVNVAGNLLMFVNHDIPGPSRTAEVSEEIANALDVHRLTPRKHCLYQIYQQERR